MATERKVLNYELCVKGIWGRNRSIKFHVFPLSKHVDPSTSLKDDAVKTLADTEMLKQKVRVGSHYSVHERLVTLTEYGEGLESESYIPTDDRIIISGIYGQLDPTTKF